MRIYVRVTPRTSKNEIIKLAEGEYKVKLTAAPVGGKANELLLECLAKHFRVAKSCVQIVGGKSAKTKIIDITC